MEVLTAILVIVTGVYVWLTHRMSNMSERSVQMMKEQIEAMSRPYLVIQPTIKPHTQTLYLKIYNSGKTPALNIKLELDKDFNQFDDVNNNLRTVSAFSSTIDSFAPNQELYFPLGQGHSIFGESKNSLPKQFVVTATYSYMDKEVVEKNSIDLRPFCQSEGETNLVAEELKKVRQVLEKFGK